MDRPTDLLLLNVSNYPRAPLFPYAFVQVAEVARRSALEVVSVDLLYTLEAALRPELVRLLARHEPRAIGIHLRQLDSLFIEEYRGYWPRDAAASPSSLPGGAMVAEDGSFRPVEATQRLVALLRELTSAPILLGGHGFTSNPQAVFRRIRPDVAVVGEPDALFARFDDVLAGKNLESVPNLIFDRDGTITTTPRQNFGPAEGPEYTAAIIDDVKRFYGLAGLANQTFSVEVMRGCPYHCYFCCEPAVKGRAAKTRPIDAVIEDVELLTWHGLDRIWMVCSELNVFGPELALSLGERLLRLQEKTGRSLRWHAFSLPSRMNLSLWRTLARSGFRGGFNTFLSLDDDNLKRGRIPHRAIDAIEEYKNIEIVSRELAPGDEIRSRGTMALFLGNSYATTETIARSLRAMAEHGLLETVRLPGSMVATRVFETLDADPARDVNELVTFAAESADVDLSLPSFEYPAALINHFAGRRPLERFMYWLDMTVLSKLHERTKDWSLFLANWSSPESLARLIAAYGMRGGSAEATVLLSALLEEPRPGRLRTLLWPSAVERQEIAVLVPDLLALLFVNGERQVHSALRVLGLPESVEGVASMPIFDLLQRLYSRFATEEDAIGAVRAELDVDDGSLEVLFARWLFYRRNVVLDPVYRAPLFDVGTPGSKAPRRLAIVG